MSQPFLPWLDVASYIPAGDQGFEAGAGGWTLDGASVVDGNEPWNVAQDGGSHSLKISAGGSATTATVCAGIEHPTIRFFAKRSAGLGSSLAVEALVETASGGVLAVPLAPVTAGTSWSVTLPIPVVANLLPLLPGERTPIAFRFTPQGSASWTIDDVFVDPWRRT